jgi:anti-sigma regulatory factor (Ser/Thr protein kinase)
MSAEPVWRAVFPGTLDGIAAAGRWIEELSAEQGFPEELTFGVQLCVEELFANLVRHGGGLWEKGPAAGTAPVRMSISMSRRGDELAVVLEDDGAPFDVAAAQPKPVGGSLETVQPGGLGIQLVNNFSSGLAYERVDGVNRTALKFPWPTSEFSLL